MVFSFRAATRSSRGKEFYNTTVFTNAQGTRTFTVKTKIQQILWRSSVIKPLQQRATEKNCVNNEGLKNWQPSNIKVGRQNSLFKKKKKKKKIKKNSLIRFLHWDCPFGLRGVVLNTFVLQKKNQGVIILLMQVPCPAKWEECIMKVKYKNMQIHGLWRPAR